MENELCRKRTVYLGIIIFLLFLNLIGGVGYAFTKYNQVEFSDFSRRYRESSYVAEGVNPFDVVYGIDPIDPKIGEMPRNSGYPAWSMAIGIITNFTMFSEETATKLTLLLMLAGVFIAGIALKRYADEQRWEELDKWILVLSGVGIYGFWTGISYLNFGALVGVLLFLFVLLDGEEHPVWGGIVMGVASVKPVLAAPFFLALFLRKKWKPALLGGAIACVSWMAASIMTKTPPLEYLSAMSEEGNTYWSNSFFASIAAVFDIQLETKALNMLSAIVCIGIALALWVLLIRTSDCKANKWEFYAIPAVLSGCWMYSQEHDRTVMLIFLVALFNIFQKLNDRNLKWLVSAVIVSGVVGREVVVQYLCILIGTNIQYRAVDIIFRIIWIVGLIILVENPCDKFRGNN